MSRNNKSSNNINYYSIHTGLYTDIYHQYYQMVDLLIQYSQKLIDGLNPYVLLYVLSQYQEDAKMNRKQEEKDQSSNLKKPLLNDKESTKV